MWGKLQAEHKKWVESVYPRQLPDIPACGLVEEAGELVHAVLKYTQRAVWGEETRYPKALLEDKIQDAVGDIAIYACSFCNAAGWDFDDVMCVALANPSEAHATPLKGAVRIVRTAVDFATKPYCRTTLAKLIAELEAFTDCYDGLDFAEAIQRTWDKVKRRTKEKT